MYVVAITRWARPAEQEVAALAPLSTLAVYDLRLRLAGPLPVVFERVADAERARQLLGALRQRGHGAVACDLTCVPGSEQLTSPRSYELAADAFVALDPAWGRRLMPYGDLLALIRANSASIEQSSSMTKQKKLSLGRAAMTGGLVMRKTSTTDERATTEEREQVLYLIRKTGRDPMLLRERHLRHQGLGEQVKPTSLENFASLVVVLRQRAPQVLYDDRLATHRRKTSITSLAGSAAHQVTSSSNASENDLAAHLIAVAHLKGQL